MRREAGRGCESGSLMAAISKISDIEKEKAERSVARLNAESAQ